MNTPFISICIPAYKRPECLVRLLNSISEQTYKHYEIIITDDSPGSEVRDRLQAFTHLPIQYFHNVPALGPAGNWNFSISKANGEWVQLLHADDWYSLPTSLQQFADAIAAGKSDFIFCASKEINLVMNSIKNMQLTQQKKELLDGGPVNLLFDNVIGHPSVVIHKKDRSIQYDTSFKWVVDIDFYIRYLQQHGSYQYIPDCLVNIGMDTEQVSETSYKNPFVEIPEFLFLLEKFPGSIVQNNLYVFSSLWNLVKKFRIKDWDYIKAHGYTGYEIEAVSFIIAYQKKIPRLIIKQTNWSAVFVKKCFAKWQKKNNREYKY